jgi:hypothetical protein
MMKTYTMKSIAKELDEKEDTLRKARLRNAVSKRLAKKLENLTGIQRLRWLYPDEFGNPWDIII